MSNRFARGIQINEKTEKILNSLPEIVWDWYYNLSASNRSPRTCQEYVRTIKLFYEYCEDNGIHGCEALTESILTKYMIKTQTKQNKYGEYEPTSCSYRKTVWSVLNSFVSYLHKRHLIECNFMENVARPRNEDDVKRYYLTETDFMKILKCVKDDKDRLSNTQMGMVSNRNILIFMIFMATGMRRTALSDIDISDIDIGSMTLTIVDKGSVEHKYYLDNSVMEVFFEWMEDRETILDGEKSEALFITLQKQRLSDKTIYDIVKKYTGKALGYSISPHKLRAGFCTILYDKTKDIKFVSKAVGHKDVGTTQIYVQTDNKDQVRAAKMMGGLFI